MLINEAADAVNQGVATVADVDTAMRKGVNYPRGPLAWADELGIETIQNVLVNLAVHYGGDRYRVSPKIRQLVMERRHDSGVNPLPETRSKREIFMSEAVICDAIRTPFGRYGGTFVRCAYGRSRRNAHSCPDGTESAGRLAGGGRRDLRLRESGRRGQSQCRAHGFAAGRPSAGCPRYDRESALRLQHGRGWDCGPCDQVRRSGSDYCRWRGKHVPCSVRDGKG